MREPGGAPAEDVAICLRKPDGPAATDILRSNKTGIVKATGLPAAPLDVIVLPHSRHTSGGHQLGRADLIDGDGEIDITIGRRRELVFRFRENGGPGLPKSFQLYVDGVGVFGAIVDRVRGEVSVERRPLWHERAFYYQFRAQGYFPLDGWLWPEIEGDRAVFDIVVFPGGGLAAKLIPPPDGERMLLIRRLAGNEWCSPEVFHWVVQPDPDNTLRLRPLKAGIYKLVDLKSGLSSGTFEVADGDTPTETVFDLSSTGWVTGTVEVPDEFHASGAHVCREADGIEPGKADVNGDGSFRIRVPGDRPVVLIPRHPLLQPAEDAGSVTRTDPGPGVVLKLVVGTLAEFQIDEYAYVSDWRALLFHGGVGGEPEFTGEVVPRGTKRLRFGGFKPGTYDVFLDLPFFAPTVLTAQELGGGRTDLGSVSLERGSWLNVKLLLPEELASLHYVILATRKGAPVYSREALWQGRDTTVMGLAAGEFEVRIREVGTEEFLRVKTIEVDGLTDKEIVFDLR